MTLAPRNMFGINIYLCDEGSGDVAKGEALIEIFHERFLWIKRLWISEVGQVSDKSLVVVIQDVVQVFNPHVRSGAGAQEVSLERNDSQQLLQEALKLVQTRHRLLRILQYNASIPG